MIIYFKDIYIQKIKLGNLDKILFKNNAKFKLKNSLYKDLKKYLSGKRVEFFKYNIYIKRVNLFSNIYIYLKNNIKWGQLINYKDIAKVFDIKDYRIIGYALNKNPYPIIVPCHRVIKTNGNIGGFSEGVNIKKKLLQLEGHNF